MAKVRLDYIMGNPPFVGYGLQSKEQKQDILSIYVDENGKAYKTAGKIDYVAGWYFKAAQYINKTGIRAIFVSTNSITQGEQVVSVWQPLYDCFGIHIDFAHRTFCWDSEASLKAHVYVVIVGFSQAPLDKPLHLFENGRPCQVKHINPYLLEAVDVFIASRSKPLCPVLLMSTGNRPADDGHLIIEADAYDDFIRKESHQAKKWKGFGLVKAQMKVDDGLFIVLKGSTCVPAREGWIPDSLKTASIKDHVLQADVSCNSPSTYPIFQPIACRLESTNRL